MMTWMIRVSFFANLVIYKAYFKSHQVQKQRPITHILCVKLLRLYALGFCNEVFLDLHHLYSEELCSQTTIIQVAGVSHILGFMQRS